MATYSFGNISSYQFEAGAISLESMWYIHMFVNVGLTELVSLLGLIFNVVNIIIFIKQSTRDSTNIALLGLAVSDAGASLSLLFWSQQYNPLVLSYRGDVDLMSILTLTTVWPHVLFTRITCWIMAYITIERYLCIAIPLKVKIILNVNRTTGFVVSIFVIMIVSIVPIYVVNAIGSMYFPVWNMTITTVIYSSNWQVTHKIVTFYNAFVQLTAFGATAIFTFALVQKFIAKTRWRRAKSNISDASGLSKRDKKFIQTVILISIIFIICYIPSVIATIAMVIVKEVSVLFVPDFSDVLWPFAFLMESINSTVSIFIYLKMSSRYKAVFCVMFDRCLRTKFVNAHNKPPESESVHTVDTMT